MRIKKAFTLAEILIVLMVIGVIATMTVPSLMKGVNEAQFKTAYKKAFNTITNLASVEKISGQLPAKASANGVFNLYKSLNSNLSVKEYASYEINSGGIAPDSAFKNGTVLTDGDHTDNKATLGEESNNFTYQTATGSPSSAIPWIITEDNLAYSVIAVGGKEAGSKACYTKSQLNALTKMSELNQAACAIVVVDVNGLSKGPNLLENQEGAGPNTVGTSSAALKQLVGDQYYIYLGSDGATAGNKFISVSGRIMSDMK